MNDDFICRKDIERFIENGLNNPDKEKAFGHDAIEILTEVHFMTPANVRPVIRYKWQTLDTEFAGRAFVCPCNFIGTEKTNFCPDCGADMREVE